MVEPVKLSQYADGSAVFSVGAWLLCNCAVMDDVMSAIVREDGRPSLPFVMDTPICEHIRSAMKSASDASHARLQGPVVVPLLWQPMELAMYTVVHVDDQHLHGMAAVQATNGVLSSLKNDYPPVGFLDEKEGRWAIRSMYFEWLRNAYLLLPACQSDYHGRKRLFGPVERRKLDADTTQVDVLRSIESMVRSGVCFDCSLTDISDMVPDI